MFSGIISIVLNVVGVVLSLLGGLGLVQ